MTGMGGRVDKNSWFRTLIVILVFIAVLYLGGQLYQVAIRFGDIILLFFLAWLLAFILSPITRLLEACKIPRLAAALIVYTGLLLLVTLLGFMVLPNTVGQLYQLGQNLPQYARQAPEVVAQINVWLQDRGVEGVDLNGLITSQGLLGRAESVGTVLAQNALGFAQGAASLVFNLVIVVILSYYFMMDGDRVAAVLLRVLPDRYKAEARFFLDSIERSFGGFVRGIAIQSAIYGLGTAAVMWIAGLHYIALVSAFAAVVMIIPFLGTFLAIVPPIVLAALSESWGTTIFVSVALLVLQQIVLNVVSPKVMSDSVGIHPLLVFLAMLVGVREAGIWGAVFGVPIMAVLYSTALFIYNRANPSRQIGAVPATDAAVASLSPRFEES